ncbi:transposase InsO family protein [Arthrobacter sp. UYNi723]
MTDVRVGDQKLYLTPVMDLVNRQVISCSIGASPNLNLTNASMREALDCLELGQQLLHSGHGSGGGAKGRQRRRVWSHSGRQFGDPLRRRGLLLEIQKQVPNTAQFRARMDMTNQNPSPTPAW